MEWTWLRDWWRLKRLRHSQLRHSHEDIYYGNNSDDEDDDDDDDICYCDECVNVGDLFLIESGYHFNAYQLYTYVSVSSIESSINKSFWQWL